MEILLSDTSVLLNLIAADCLGSIAGATGWQFAICPAVRDEVKKLRDADTGEMIEVDVTPYLASGLLQLLEINGQQEETLYVEESMAVDDGEAMSIAIAVHRKLALAIDDKQAANHTHRKFPKVRLWSTPEILKYWTEVAVVDGKALSQAIRQIETRARYFPSKFHALATWWKQSSRTPDEEIQSIKEQGPIGVSALNTLQNLLSA